MRLIITLVVVSLLAVSCKEKPANIPSALVSVNKKTLTREELNENVSNYLAPEDSIIAAEHFIQTWIMDNLMYDEAFKKIADKDLIEQLVENYRKSLVTYQYREQMVNEKLSKDISESEVLEYYNLNKERFQLDRPLVKGLFIKVPTDAPTIDKVRAWVKSSSQAALMNIESYCVRNAIPYDYIVDDWVDFNELTADWPLDPKSNSELIKNNKFVEKKGNQYHYFFNTTEYLLPGDDAPFYYAEPAVRAMLVNQKKIEFLKDLENELYQKALNSGDIIFYDK